MSASRWRSSLTGVFFVVACLTFVAIDIPAARGWMLLVGFGVIPPAMLLWLWSRERPVLVGRSSSRPNRP